MKLKNKGFTMIELLAAITLLGIISSIAVVSYSKYQEKARNNAYEAMEKSALSAAQTYIQDKGLIIPTISPEEITAGKEISIETLVNGGYLNNLQDPRKKGSYCHNGSKVIVSKQERNKDVLDQYTFIVIIKCNGYTSSRQEDGTTIEGKIFKS